MGLKQEPNCRTFVVPLNITATNQKPDISTHQTFQVPTPEIWSVIIFFTGTQKKRFSYTSYILMWKVFYRKWLYNLT